MVKIYTDFVKGLLYIDFNKNLGVANIGKSVINKQN